MISMLYVAMTREQDVAREYEMERADAREYERTFGVSVEDATRMTIREKAFVAVAGGGIAALMLACLFLS